MLSCTVINVAASRLYRTTITKKNHVNNFIVCRLNAATGVQHIVKCAIKFFFIALQAMNNILGGYLRDNFT